MLSPSTARAAAATILLVVSSVALRAQPSPRPEPGVITRTSGSAASGLVHLRLGKVYYDVEGATPDALADALGRRGPRMGGRRFFGMTEWEVHAQYQGRTRRGRCEVRDLTVRVSVETHLPRWRRRYAAPPALGRAWDRFLTALDRHEHGHRVLAEQAAEAIRRRLRVLNARSCDRVEREAYREVELVLDEYEVHNEVYDRATDHGRSQGAVWPPQRRLR